MSKFTAILDYLELAYDKNRNKRILLMLSTSADAAEDMLEYSRSYEAHSRIHRDDSVIGGGDFELVGQLMLSALVVSQMQPHHALLDFGCGVGRLARQALPYLKHGAYFGVEISPTILSRGRKRILSSHAVETEGDSDRQCCVKWLLQKSSTLPDVASDSIDYIAAFSVFTHLEPEDYYRYLQGFQRIARDSAVVVASFLILSENPTADEVFRVSAAKPIAHRYREVRNVVTTRNAVEQIAKLAGWQVVQWYAHDEPAFRTSCGKEMGLGQTVAVMRKCLN